MRPAAERFWEKVSIAGPDECWPWKATRTKQGYGQFWDGTSIVYAHRYSTELAAGSLGKSFGLHSCDNPPCVNPAHISPGSAMDNSHDARDKGRLTLPPTQGVDNGNAALSEVQVREIFTRRHRGEALDDLAREYRVTAANISLIARGRTWKHLNLTTNGK